MLSCIVDKKYTEASRKLDRKQNFQCPECLDSVILKAGAKKIPHFSHKCGSYCAHGEGETIWHRKGKLCIADIARSNGYHVEFEKKLGDRRTDVFVYDKKSRIAFELQRKDEGHEIYTRTRDLAQYVDKVIWVLPWKVTEILSGRLDGDDIVYNSRYRATATYSINALYSDHKKPHKSNIRFYDDKKNQLITARKSTWQIYVEESEFGDECYGGYYRTSKRWCQLDIENIISA